MFIFGGVVDMKEREERHEAGIAANQPQRRLFRDFFLRRTKLTISKPEIPDVKNIISRSFKPLWPITI